MPFPYHAEFICVCGITFYPPSLFHTFTCMFTNFCSVEVTSRWGFISSIKKYSPHYLLTYSHNIIPIIFIVPRPTQPEGIIFFIRVIWLWVRMVLINRFVLTGYPTRYDSRQIRYEKRAVRESAYPSAPSHLCHASPAVLLRGTWCPTHCINGSTSYHSMNNFHLIIYLLWFY